MLLAGTSFVLRELRCKDPLIHFRFFRYRNYIAATGGMIIAGFTQIGILFFVNFFIQAAEGLNFSASQAGLALLPFTAVMFVIALVAPHVIPPKGYRLWAAASMLSLAIGFWLMHSVDHQTPFEDVWWRLLFVGAGVGLNMVLLPRIGLGALPEKNAGQGSGVLNTCLYSGLAIGTALGAVVVTQIKRYFVDPVVNAAGGAIADPQTLKITLVHGSQSQVGKAIAAFPKEELTRLQDVMLKAFDHGFSGVMILMTIAALIGIVLCIAVIRSDEERHTE